MRDCRLVLLSHRSALLLLAMYLLDPESDDGLITWNAFDAYRARRNYPVLRSPAP